MFEKLSKLLLISDLDGTLLPSSKIPSKETLNAINSFVEAGGNFSIATGRGLETANTYLETIPINCPVILYNGGMLYDLQNNSQLFSALLPEKAKELTEQILKDNPSIGCEILPLKGTYVPQMNDVEDSHCKTNGTTPIICSLSEIPKDWFKVVFTLETEHMEAFAEYMKKISAGHKDIDFVVSSPFFLEMLPHGATKGRSLQELKDICKINDYTIVAIGDYENDIEMLKTADFSICPSNASDAVKDISDFCLPVSCEESAVAAVIKYILQQIP